MVYCGLLWFPASCPILFCGRLLWEGKRISVWKPKPDLYLNLQNPGGRISARCFWGGAWCGFPRTNFFRRPSECNFFLGTNFFLICTTPPKWLMVVPLAMRVLTDRQPDWQHQIVHHLGGGSLGLPPAPWCTTEVGGAQCRSIVHNVALYHCGDAQHRSYKPTQTHTDRTVSIFLLDIYLLSVISFGLYDSFRLHWFGRCITS